MARRILCDGETAMTVQAQPFDGTQTFAPSEPGVERAMGNGPPTFSLALYWLAGLIVSGIGGLVCHDWIGSLALLALFAYWRILRPEEGPPVLSMAFTFQWTQACIGMFYYAITDRYSPTIALSDYRPMVLIGLGSVCALFSGIGIATWFQRMVNPNLPRGRTIGLNDQQLAILYLAALITSGAIVRGGARFPGLYQGATVLSYFRYALLFLVFRKLSRPTIRWSLLVPLLAFEVLLGFTGFFADFREPIIFALLAMLEIFDGRNIRHWMTLAASGAMVVVLAVTWTAIKPEFRSAQLEQTTTRSQRVSILQVLTRRFVSNGDELILSSLDGTIDRLWAIYYPALAVERVPSMIPHTNGKMMWDGVKSTVTPRLFFPNKPNLIHDSEKVREYSGQFVAGEAEGSSIAFGYAAEMYVDYGVPFMFLPVFIAGFLFGIVYRRISRAMYHRDVAVSVVAVVIWMPIFQFEQSWARLLGFSLSTMIFVGGVGVLLDRYVSFRRRTAQAIGRVAA